LRGEGAALVNALHTLFKPGKPQTKSKAVRKSADREK
jgi:hypothetical protein